MRELPSESRFEDAFGDGENIPVALIESAENIAVLSKTAAEIVEQIKSSVVDAHMDEEAIEEIRETGLVTVAPAIELLIGHALRAGVDPMELRADLLDVEGSDAIAEVVRLVDISSLVSTDVAWRGETRNLFGVVVLDDGNRVKITEGRRVDKAGLRSLALAILKRQRG